MAGADPIAGGYVNQVKYFNTLLIDLTGDTVTPETLAEGVTAHDKSGEQITGTMTAASAPTLQTKLVNPSAVAQTITPDTGYDGLSEVLVNGDADLTAANIKLGVEIFGVTGTYEGSGSLQASDVVIEGGKTLPVAYTSPQGVFTTGTCPATFQVIKESIICIIDSLGYGEPRYAGCTLIFHNTGVFVFAVEEDDCTIKFSNQATG